MAEPFRLVSPFSRIIAVRNKSLYNGLADPQSPVHILPEGLNRVYGRDAPDDEWHVEARLQTNAYQFITNKPSMFTGEMRAVVQDNRSRNVPVSYSPNFSNTNGIFVSTNGDRWVLEITSGSLSAWKMEKRTSTDPEQILDTLGYIPPRTLKEEHTDTLITLTPTTGSLTGPNSPYAPGRGPLFSECGWAFNSDGTKACAVTFEDRQDAPDNPGPEYPFSRLWEIVITEQNNQPFSYAVTELESGWLWGDRITIVKFPLYSVGSLDYFDWFRGNLTISPVDAGFESPVHAWYEGNTMQVVRYSNSGGTSSSLSTFPALDQNYALNAQPTNEGTPGYGSYSYTRGVIRGFSSPAITGYYSKDSESGNYRHRVIQSKSNIGVSPSTDSASWNTGQAYASYIETLNGRTKNTSNQDVVVIPFFERCGVFHKRSSTVYDAYAQSAIRDWEALHFPDVGERYGANSLYSGFGATEDNQSWVINYWTSKDSGLEKWTDPISHNYEYSATPTPTAYLLNNGTYEYYGYFVAIQKADCAGWGAGELADHSTDPCGFIARSGGCIEDAYPAGCVTYQGDCYYYTSNYVVNFQLPEYPATLGTDVHRGTIVYNDPPPETYCGESWDPRTVACCAHGRNGMGLIAKSSVKSPAWTKPSNSYTPTVITDTTTYSAIVYIDGNSYSLPIDEDIDTVYHTRYWDNGNGGIQEKMLIVSDASGNMGAIYTEVPFPHAVGYNGGTFWACFNEGLYPIDEIGQFYPEWLGNPE